MTRNGRTRAASVGLLLLVLVAGFSIGMAWDQNVHAAAVVGSAAEDEEKERDYVIDKVGLNEEQRDDVERIIEHYHAQLKALNDEFQERYEPRRKAVGQEARDSIFKVLDPQQSVQYDSLLEARRLEREARNEDGGGADY